MTVHIMLVIILMTVFVTQICQYIKDSNKLENLAPPLSEEMWIEEDGTPYVYYSNPSNQNRYQK